MKPVHINLARHDWRRSLAATAPMWWGVALAGVLLLASAGYGIRQLLEVQAAREAQIHATQRQTMQASAPAVVIPVPQAVAVNVAIAQLNLPWRDLGNAIAEALTPEVSLLSVEPDAKAHKLRLTGQAPGSEPMVAFIEGLKHQPQLRGVVLTHHEIDEQDPSRPIHFQIDMQLSEQGVQP